MASKKSGLNYLGILYDIQKILLRNKTINFTRYLSNLKNMLIVLLNTIFIQNEADNNYEMWTRNELLSIINIYISTEGKDEQLLNDCLIYLKSEFELEAFKPGKNENPYYLKVNLAVLSIYEKLIEFSSEKYLNGKLDFIKKTEELGIEVAEELEEKEMPPSAIDCGEKLFHEDKNIQLEYAKYLALMKNDAADAHTQIINRLMSAFGNAFYDWTDSINFGLDTVKVEKNRGGASLLCALIDALGYIHKEKTESFISIIYALSSTDYMVKEHARDALINIGCLCLPELKQTFYHLQEDFGRDKMLEVLQTFSSCRDEVVPFLESLNIKDGYLQGRIQETISLIKK